MKTVTAEYEGKPFDIYWFNVPMWHEDFHKAEELGLTYVYTDATGNDYWDYEMAWVKDDMEEIANKYFTSWY